MLSPGRFMLQKPETGDQRWWANRPLGLCADFTKLPITNHHFVNICRVWKKG